MLTLEKGKRNFFPTIVETKKGEDKERWLPGSYSIDVSDGHTVVVYKRYGRQMVSVKAPPTPTHDSLGRVTGVEPKRKVTFRGSWEEFETEFARCGFPAIVLEGIEQADEELAAKRAA